MPKTPLLPHEPPKVESLEEARQVIGELWGLVHELAARLEQNSQNSSKPPSSDAPGGGGVKPARPPSAHPRGAQPGHTGHRREQVGAPDTVIEHIPEEMGRAHV